MGSTFVFDMRSGGATLNLTGSSNMAELNVGNNSNASTVHINPGADVTAGIIVVARDGNGNVSVDGGVLTANYWMRVGWGNGGGGNITLNSGTIITPELTSQINPTGLSNSLNLNGGVLETARIFSVGSGQPFTTTMNGGTIKITGNDSIFKNFGGTNEVTVQIGSGGGTIDTNGFNTTSERPIVDAPSASGPLTKRGTGTLTLAAANTYTGPTTVENGTLALSASGSISANTALILGVSAGTTGTFDVTSKAAYSLADVLGNGTLNIGAGKTITATGNVSPGFSAGALNVTGNFTLAATAATALEIEGQSAVSYTHLTLPTIYSV